MAARLRVQTEDFVVAEQLPFDLSGAGEHLWLRIRKRGLNSEQVAVALSRAVGVSRRDIGYAGMKDRHAETIQWFSMLLGQRPTPEWSGLPAGIEILEVTRHARKLKTGALSGNDFVLTLRDCQGNVDELMTRVETIRTSGVPNYFGEQRFGHDGENIERAIAMFGEGAPLPSRHKRGIYLSAARSLIFNDLLARRVQDGSWNRLQDGEAVVLDGSRSFFVAAQIDEVLHERLARRDIHPSGPLWGRGEIPSQGKPRALEEAIAAQHPALAAGLVAAGLEQERRALRVFPRDLQATWTDPSTLRLSFGLPAGCYATALVRELADYLDAGRNASADH